MTIPSKKQQGGFTLLELVVVVAVLGLIANLATEFVAQNTNQERFEATKARQAMIREAILGNPSATQNGEVQVSGFIADMGRAPNNLRELLTKDGYCADPDHFDIAEQPDNPIWNAKNECDAAAGIADTWIAALGSEWKGPYLRGFELETIEYNGDDFKYRTFRDGWGNSSSAWAISGQDAHDIAYEDFLNFGWNYYVGKNSSEGMGIDEGKNENLDDIFAISAGLDGDMDPGSDAKIDRTGSDADSDPIYKALSIYERDYPRTEYFKTGLTNPDPDPERDLKHTALIQNNEYTSKQPITLNVQNNSGSDSASLCVRIWRNNDEDKKDLYKPSSESAFIVSASSNQDQIIELNGINVNDSLPNLISAAHGLYHFDVVEASDCTSIADNSDSVCQITLQPSVLSSKTSVLNINCVLTP